MHSPRPSQPCAPPPEGEDALVWKEEATRATALSNMQALSVGSGKKEGRLFGSTEVNQDFSKKPGGNMRPSVLTTLQPASH